MGDLSQSAKGGDRICDHGKIAVSPQPSSSERPEVERRTFQSLQAVCAAEFDGVGLLVCVILDRARAPTSEKVSLRVLQMDGVTVRRLFRLTASLYAVALSGVCSSICNAVDPALTPKSDRTRSSIFSRRSSRRSFWRPAATTTRATL